ncbi:protease [Acidobacteria bacterium ACD]|nr:MAG: protease [Acidobacteriota bacterium]MCE7956613.1 protease [Acidobacteria bacterium ACB2]MDL1948388.1 protease [Acidobacteria bacterium ACD]
MRKPRLEPPPAKAPATTGRLLVLFREGLDGFGVADLRNAAGLRAACSADFAGCRATEDDLGEADAYVLHELGVALVDADPDQARSLAEKASAQGPLLAVEPERAVRALHDDPSHLPEYLRGYRDAVNDLVAQLAAEAAPGALDLLGSPALGESEYTWGLQATNVHRSAFSGKGVKVAVLDTGFDLKHPDYPHREIVAESFVPGSKPQDGHGHGTHCIGTACGPKAPYHMPRYGVAHEAGIHAGKVLDDNGGGADGWILAGVNWAISKGCRVVSMSLGAEVSLGQPYSKVFETAAKRGLKKGTLVVAAAGNESERRTGHFAPVGHPANCPSVMAVGALDPKLRVPSFSNRGLDPKGGQVDVAAPGVDVHSSFPMPERYQRLSGTSMATPHVAGIAALLAEANPTATPLEIWTLITQTAKRLPLLATDVGAGLVQAP